MKKRLFRYAAYALLALVAFGAGVWMRDSRLTETPAASGAEAIFALKLPDLKGQTQSLDQWRGKVVVVNFWATWCPPCLEEIPLFVKTQEKYAGNGLQFVGISIDQVDKTSEFSSKFKMNYPVLVGTFDTVEVSRQAGNRKRSLPFTLVFDRQGRIAATELGGIKEEKLETLLKPLL